MELLAPAGGFEQLRAAIDFGADAVYLAAERFGMRARAANFTYEDLPNAISYAHDHGVAVHVTCNVMVMQDELKDLPLHLERIAQAGADALIIGDMGAFALAKKYAPGVELHVSTQASIANSAAALAWVELGASRIVCAREMSLAQISQMRQELPPEVQIEAFAHGAQCMAVSGRCLISAYMADRSGNRGHCTQPCRWLFYDKSADNAEGNANLEGFVADSMSECASPSCGAQSDLPQKLVLEEETRPGQEFILEQDNRGSYFFNARDLNMSAYLAQMQAAGVDSIKIEGRNKKAFYVASVVGAYRAALDGAPQEAVDRELLSISHRPYSTGFYFGEAKQNGQAVDYDGYEQETLHVADIVEVAELEASLELQERYKVTIRCRNRVAPGDELETLEPGGISRTFRVKNLMWVGDDAGEVFDVPRECEVANRSCNLYTIELDFAPDVRGFIRRREHRRTGRHLK